MNLNFAKNISVLIVLYILPLLVFWIIMSNKGIKKCILFFLSIIYLIIGIPTQNIFPFILVLFCIFNMRSQTQFYDDYYRYDFGFQNFKFSNCIKYSVISYILAIFIANITMNLFSRYNIPIKDQEIMNIMEQMPLIKFIIMMPVTMIFAPIVEEYVFRWFLYEKFFKKYIGIIASAIITSLIFGIVHFNLKSFLSIFCIGLFNCFLIHKKGYWYAVLNHSAFNSVSTVVMLIEKLNID